MRNITGRIATFIIAAALATVVSACTNSPLGPSQGDGDLCYIINGHLICASDG